MPSATTIAPARLARREEARVLARACAIAAGLLAQTVLVPFSPTAPRGVGLALCVVAVALWATLTAAGDRVRAWHLHALLAVATALTTLALSVSTTPFGALVGAVSFLWIAIFSGVYHRTRVLARYLAGIAAGMAVGLWHADAPSGPQSWAFLMVTFGGLALVLNRRVSALRREAMTDPLTGAFTRRAFERAAELDMARASRTGLPLTLVVIDLDDFKRVNDAHGHARGDEVLVGLTAEWQAALPRDVLLGRRGGDEFALLFPGRTLQEAEDEVRALSDALCGWSAGAAEWDGGRDLADLFAAADADLYASKASTSGTGGSVGGGGGVGQGAQDGGGRGMGSEPATL